MTGKRQLCVTDGLGFAVQVSHKEVLVSLSLHLNLVLHGGPLLPAFDPRVVWHTGCLFPFSSFFFNPHPVDQACTHKADLG